MLNMLVYVSSASPRFADGDLDLILEASRRNNPSCDVTGMLLFADGNFFQVLEGPAEAVQTTFARIGGDPRHNGIIRLLEAPIEARNFPDWTMGFRRLDKSDLPAGAFDLTRERFQSIHDRDIGADILALMKTFYRTVYMHEA